MPGWPVQVFRGCATALRRISPTCPSSSLAIGAATLRHRTPGGGGASHSAKCSKAANYEFNRLIHSTTAALRHRHMRTFASNAVVHHAPKNNKSPDRSLCEEDAYRRGGSWPVGAASLSAELVRGTRLQSVRTCHRTNKSSCLRSVPMKTRCAKDKAEFSGELEIRRTWPRILTKKMRIMFRPNGPGPVLPPNPKRWGSRREVRPHRSDVGTPVAGGLKSDPGAGPCSRPRSLLTGE